MTQNDLFIKRDRMRYTKDSLSSGLVLLAIVFNVLYFISIYQSDVGNYYYTWFIGASVIYNLLFLLIAFLISQGVKNRKTGYGATLLIIGLLQIGRIFYLPTKAHEAMILIGGEELAVMSNGQYAYVVFCLIASAVCCVVAAVTSHISNNQLAQHMRELEKKSA
ncbi:MAG: hypothetical protein J6V34_04645 [Oscillospiraceae bacterium]|nr:hypothetical protein [Oscillospiraceae bacterium]